MKDYNELVKNVLEKRRNECQGVKKEAERIIEEVIKKFNSFLVDSVIIEVDESQGSILLSGKEIFKDSSKAMLVFEEVSKILDGDIPEMEAFNKKFYFIKKEYAIKISIK